MGAQLVVAKADWQNSVAQRYPSGPTACPADATGLSTSGLSLSCSCSAAAAAEGSVWGSGPYTTDSSICRAARHAGRIGWAGGLVSLRTGGGRSEFRGSDANGVSAGDWDSYPRSFDFAR